MAEKDIDQTDNQSVEEMDINSDDSIPGTSHINDVMEEEGVMQKLLYTRMPGANSNGSLARIRSYI